MDLRRLILVLTLCSAVIPFAHTFYASYVAQRQQLIDNALAGNAAYATKLAKSTDDFLQSAQQQLAFTANVLSSKMQDNAALIDEAARLRLQTQSFNSVAIYDRQGTVLATSPEMLELQGRTLRSVAVQQALAAQRPLISEPFLSIAGNYIVLLTYPVLGAKGELLGVVGGSIYLKDTSILNRLLGTHYYKDGSYLFVVDRDKHILYHPNPARIGERIVGNPVIDDVVRGNGGSGPVTNSKGQAMLAGYAVVHTTGWGLVSQRPEAATLAPLDTLVQNMLRETLPVGAVMLVLIWWGARRIARPLRQLANGARSMDQPETVDTIQTVQSWYFEAHELKKALLTGMDLLHRNISQLRADVYTDPLTGLGNRRQMDAALARFQAQQIPFSAVALDIDHFKRVNDSFGHDVGDHVLQQLAHLMREVCRVDDLPCRMGGEEFVLLLPRASSSNAAQVAERLRQLVESSELLPVQRVTLSLGVAAWPEHAPEVATVLKKADAMLYAAKHAGRNRVVLYGAADVASADVVPAKA